MRRDQAGGSIRQTVWSPQLEERRRRCARHGRGEVAAYMGLESEPCIDIAWRQGESGDEAPQRTK